MALYEYFSSFHRVALFALFGSVVCPPPKIPPLSPLSIPPRGAAFSSAESSPSQSFENTPSAPAMPANSGPIFDNFTEWITGKKMPYVTLLRYLDGQKFEGGFVKSRLRSDGWYWDFYAANSWDPISMSTKLRATPCDSFEINAVGKTMHRRGEVIAFQSVAPGTDKLGSYRIIFACEDDAKNFTGEAWPYVVTF